MLEWLKHIDREIVLFVNGWHTPFLDEFMWWVSARITWVPLYVLLIVLAWKKLEVKRFWLFLALVGVAIGLTDLASVHLFKNVFLRYRPSHNLLLENKLHFYEMAPGDYYKGGQYGFVSSHAANFFAIIIFVWLSLRNYYRHLLLWLLPLALLICLSRIYLGAHYLSDVIGGALVGSTVSLFVWRFLFVPFTKKWVE